MKTFSGFSGFSGFHAGGPPPVARPMQVGRHYRHMEHLRAQRRGHQGMRSYGQQGQQYGDEDQGQDSATPETQAQEPQPQTLPASTPASAWSEPAVVAGGVAVLAAIGYMVYRNSKKRG